MLDSEDPLSSGLLLELTREVTSTLDLQEVLDRSLTALRRLVPFGGGAIQLIEGGALVAVATDPPATEDAKALRIPVGQGVTGGIARTGETVYIPDIAEDPRVFSKAKTSPGVRSFFGVPLIVHGAPIGVLHIDSPATDAFSPQARALLTSFAPAVAASVQNALLFNREREALGRLREAERMKHDFLSVVSHELRTPLTSVIGFAQTLAQRAESLDPPLVAELGHRIEAAGGRLERMISDILDLSRIERGVLRMDLASTSLERILRQIAVEARDEAHPMTIAASLNLPPVLTDADRLHQVLANLLDNARKFSPPGSRISISARRSGDWVIVTVEDHGRGIPEETIPRVFEPFFQIDAASTRAVGGLGIGLYLVREICDGMGAKVAVESEVGRGSRFSVSLPVAGQEAIVLQPGPMAAEQRT
ncbi:MAG: GAF domain-containing protein [Acidobacteria bacterium]|nr:GAF domain-containing protein [Acidobacteriota bacterium]